jgi:hypothetical protein
VKLPTIRRTAIAGLLLCRATVGAEAPQDVPGAVGELGHQPTSGPIDAERAERPIAFAARASGPIVVDGSLDEAAWQHAEPIFDFIQAQPDPGYPATEQTVVRILYDATHLYIGAIAYDSHPHKLVIPTLEHNFGGRSSGDGDVFAVSLDTFLNRQDSFTFYVNPAGAVKAGQTFNDSRETNYDWNGVLEVKTTMHENGWTVEMAIPFTTLRFDAASHEQVWGINFLRRVRRINEDSFWAPLDRRHQVHRMSQAGFLKGLTGLRPGRNLGIKPYLIAGHEGGQASSPESNRASADAGVDVKYSITSRLTLDLTYRTEFSHAEADREQINLTRFPLFFPEQREFFLENSGLFAFGDITERNYRLGSSLRDFSLFHSRRIGLRDDGRPVPIHAGGRVTGRAGNFEVGALSMHTRQQELSADRFSVLRVRRSLAENSDIGFMFIERRTFDEESPAISAYSYGVDANVRFLNYGMIKSYLAVSDDRGEDAASRLSLAWRDAFWNASASVKYVGDAFRPPAGYVRRTGVRDYYATFGAHPRPRRLQIQEANPYVEFHFITDRRSVLETRNATAGLDFDFQDGSRLNFSYSSRFERVSEPFLVAAQAEVEVGDYAFNEFAAGYQFNSGRAVSGNFGFEGGDFFSGSRRSLHATGVLRWGHRMRVDLSTNHNAIALYDESFGANVYAARVRYGYSTTLFGGVYLQYNTALDRLVTTARLNWIHAPLSDLFVIYTERRAVAQGAPLERSLTVKLTRLVGF